MTKYLDQSMSLDAAVPSESKYLTKDDAGAGKLLTIKAFAREMIGQGPDAEPATVMYFNECAKGMVIKPTNRELLKLAIGGDTVAQAIGKQVVLFNDPTVSFGGKILGGIRLRAPKTAPEPAAEEQLTQQAQAYDDEIPF